MRLMATKEDTLATTTAAPRLLTSRQVGDLLGVSITSVQRLVGKGVLQPVRLGPNGLFRFRREDVEAIIRGEGP